MPPRCHDAPDSILQLWEFTEDPLSSFFALIWMGFIILVIIFGTITFILESLPFFYEVTAPAPFIRHL